MKVITLQYLEDNFDEVMDDVDLNKQHYRIQHKDGDVMLIPIESYDVLSDVYKDWVEQPQNEPPVEGFEAMPLPVQYVEDAEPKEV